MNRPILLAVGLAALMFPAGALARDRNHDGIPDRWEARHHLSTTRNVAHRDPDRDGLDNRAEFRDQTDPRDADTDDDGIRDGRDGTPDGNDVAGHVASFDGTTLVIALNDGSSLTGAVTSSTEIKCEGPDDAPATTASLRDGGDDNSADSEDNSGPGDAEDQPGDDDGADNEQEGDDNDDGVKPACSSADLTPGAVVHEASLEVTSSGPVFEEVELVK